MTCMTCPSARLPRRLPVSRRSPGGCRSRCRDCSRSATGSIAQRVGIRRLGARGSVLLRDKLLDRLAAMGDAPDHQRLAEEVLGIRGAPPALARRLVEQALVV